MVISQADYEARTEAALRGQEIQSTLARMIGSVVDLRTQAENLQETIPGKDLPNEDEIITQITATTEALDALENVLRRPPPSMGYRIYPRLLEQLSFATRGISQAQARPTDGQLQVMAEVAAEVEKAQSELQSIIDGPIAALNRLLQGQGRILVMGGN